MHGVWDSGIIERAGVAEALSMDDVAERDVAKNGADGLAAAVEEWATEASRLRAELRGAHFNAPREPDPGRPARLCIG
jgi:hypothetical protein